MIQGSTLQPLYGRNAMAFPLNQAGADLVYDVRTIAVATVQAVPLAAWSAAVLTLYRSLNGSNLFPLGLADDTLGPGADMSATIDTSAFNYLIVRATTLEGSAAFAAVTVHGKASS